MFLVLFTPIMSKLGTPILFIFINISLKIYQWWVVHSFFIPSQPIFWPSASFNVLSFQKSDHLRGYNALIISLLPTSLLGSSPQCHSTIPLFFQFPPFFFLTPFSHWLIMYMELEFWWTGTELAEPRKTGIWNRNFDPGIDRPDFRFGFIQILPYFLLNYTCFHFQYVNIFRR